MRLRVVNLGGEALEQVTGGIVASVSSTASPFMASSGRFGLFIYLPPLPLYEELCIE